MYLVGHCVVVFTRARPCSRIKTNTVVVKSLQERNFGKAKYIVAASSQYPE